MKSMTTWAWGLVFVLLAGVACEFGIGDNRTPTPIPPQASAARPPEAAFAVGAPTATPTPLPAPATPTATPKPTATPTPTATPIPLPVGAFSADSLTGSAPFTVQFNDESDGTVASWEWDFGDGTTSDEESPSHRYTVAGTYGVRLTVSGPGGADSETLPNLITVQPGPLDQVIVSPSRARVAPRLRAQFHADAFDAYGNEIEGLQFVWKAGGAGNIDPEGLFTAGSVVGRYLEDVEASAVENGKEFVGTASVDIPFSSFGTPFIDGRLTPGEWRDASRLDFKGNVPEGGTAPATLLVMNDEANLYLAVRFARNSLDPGNTLTFEFDRDLDGLLEDGDDVFVVDSNGFADDFRTTQPPCPKDSLCGLKDSDHGGTNDGKGTLSNDGSFTVYELSHPLDSADDEHDFSLVVGDTIGFLLDLQMIAAGQVFGDTRFAPDIREIVITEFVDDLSPTLGVARIDGVVNPAEWSAATKRPFETISLNVASVFTGTLYVMNDTTNLYLGITIDDDEFSTIATTLPRGDAFRIDFDNDHDRVLFEEGEDGLIVSAGLPQFGDFFLSPITEPYVSPQRLISDTEGGGTVDGDAVASRFEGLNHFEIKHPLCSGDSLDFCLKSGDVIGFRLEYLDARADGSFGGTALFPGLLTDNVTVFSIAAGPGPLATVTVEPSDVTLDICGTQSFTFRAWDEFGNEISDVIVSWSVAPEVGTIDANGVLTAGTKAGTFPSAIRVDVVKGADAAAATADVIIRPDPVSTVELQPSSVVVETEANHQFEATAFDEFGNEIPDLAYQWETTGGEITPEGLFSAGEETGAYEVSVAATFRGSQSFGVVEVVIHISCSNVSEIPTAECEALVALFNATDGPNWTNNSRRWLETDTPCSWHGVTCVGGSGHVTQIDLGRNQLSGRIPVELGNLSSLSFLWLYSNQLSGSIPTELGNLSNLFRLSLAGNQLSGSIPVELANLSNLSFLNLSSNQLSGSIPVELANLSSLSNLHLGFNQLSGNIPAELGNLSSLAVLSLHQTQLSGSIPAELGNLSSLTDLRLSGNQLSGTIPAELGSLPSLTTLDLSSNPLSGSIPSELGNLSNLFQLILSSNQLSGSIPAELGNLSNLTLLWLFSNQLSGPLPQNLTDLNLARLWFNDTALCEPPDAGFQAWLSSIDDLRSTGVICN